jgi:hypothetical protein
VRVDGTTPSQERLKNVNHFQSDSVVWDSTFPVVLRLFNVHELYMVYRFNSLGNVSGRISTCFVPQSHVRLL